MAKAHLQISSGKFSLKQTNNQKMFIMQHDTNDIQKKNETSLLFKNINFSLVIFWHALAQLNQRH